MINSYDLSNLEDSINNIFREDSKWLVSMPSTQKDFDMQFSLTNNELPIDNISFNSINETDIDLIVEIPKNRQEFNRRFII